jgi:hypothetical protein
MTGNPSAAGRIGQGDQSSDKQPIGRTGMSLEETLASVAKLEGVNAMPTNDTDPANGVTGHLTVTWTLCPNPLFQTRNRQEGSHEQGRCL